MATRTQTPPPSGEEGLALFEPFLGFADSTVQDPVSQRKWSGA